MAATSSLLLLLLLMAQPSWSAAGVRPSPNMGKFFAKAVRSIIKKSATDYLKDRAQQGVTGFSNPGNSKGDQLGSSAADTFGAFIFDLSIGLFQQQIPVIMDITSELIWVQCDSCTDPTCIRVTPPETPTFMPATSPPMAYVSCSTQYCKDVLGGDQPTCTDDDPACKYQEGFYAADATQPTWYTSGYLATETFNFGAASVDGIVFGCSGSITLPDLAGSSGFVGFSRGKLSLVTQLQLARFSYFIAPDDPDKNFVSWTTDVAAAPDQSSHSTPLIAPMDNQNAYYYVKLTGLQVDGQLLTTIPAGTFDVAADGSGGVYLSTTLPATYLEEAAYSVLRRELVSSIEGVSPVSDDLNHLCYLTQDFQTVEVPKVALVFDGANSVMELSVDNYFFNLGDGQTCLTILPSNGGSVLGSLLQAGRKMTYDIYADGGGLLTFETAEAGASPTAAGAPAQAPAAVLMVIIATLVAWWLGLQSVV